MAAPSTNHAWHTKLRPRGPPPATSKVRTGLHSQDARAPCSHFQWHESAWPVRRRETRQRSGEIQKSALCAAFAQWSHPGALCRMRLTVRTLHAMGGLPLAARGLTGEPCEGGAYPFTP